MVSFSEDRDLYGGVLDVRVSGDPEWDFFWDDLDLVSRSEEESELEVRL